MNITNNHLNYLCIADYKISLIDSFTDKID